MATALFVAAMLGVVIGSYVWGASVGWAVGRAMGRWSTAIIRRYDPSVVCPTCHGRGHVIEGD